MATVESFGTLSDTQHSAELRKAVIAGGPAPVIATTLFAAYHTGYAIAIYIAACAVVSLVSAALMPDYTGKDISAEYEL